MSARRYHLDPTSLLADGTRYLLAGGLNTLLTLLLYQLLVCVMSPALAYAGAWLVGLAFVAAVYPNKVFKGGSANLTSRTTTVGIYVIGFGMGLGIVNLTTSLFGLERLAIVAAMIVTTLFNFFAMRAVIRGRGAEKHG